MKVIKSVKVHDGRLCSIFAKGQWCKEYVVGIITRPDIGYLFAYPNTEAGLQRANMDDGDAAKYLAEAKVVGHISENTTQGSIVRGGWELFWETFRPCETGEYLLCSQVRLIRKL